MIWIIKEDKFNGSTRMVFLDILTKKYQEIQVMTLSEKKMYYSFYLFIKVTSK